MQLCCIVDLNMDKIPLKRDNCIKLENIKIVKAAIRQGDFVYTGWRHADILISMDDAGCDKPSYDDQGFIDQHGNFYRRSSADIIVRVNCIFCQLWL